VYDLDIRPGSCMVSDPCIPTACISMATHTGDHHRTSVSDRFEMGFSLQLMLSPADTLGKHGEAASSVPATTGRGGSEGEVELALLFMTGYRSLIAR
jgi:hypothetical protein